MTRTMLTALLALSVIFNVFFVIGAMTHSPEYQSNRRLQRMTRELELDARQSDRLAELRTSFGNQNAVLQGDLHHIRMQIAQELDGDAPDLDLVRDLMEQEAELAATRRASAAQHFSDFIDLLSPPQRHALGRRLAADRKPRTLPPEVASGFDEDGNGILSEEEHARARAEMRRRHEQRRHRREQARERFDTNENGTLDAEEREAMRAWLLEQGFEVSEAFDRPRSRPNEKGRRDRDKRGQGKHRDRRPQAHPDGLDQPVASPDQPL